MKAGLLLLSLVLAGGLVLGVLSLLNHLHRTAYAEEADAHSTYYVAPSCTGVPDPCYTAVQAAVDAADEVGDVVKVAAGTYTDVSARDGVTQVVYISKTLTIRGGYTTTNWTTSDPDANPTTLDARGEGRVLYIVGDIEPRVEALRITGGSADGLGGSGWWGEDVGGGVYAITATAIISSNQVFSNTAYSGGGMYLCSSASTLSGNTVFDNSAHGYGGGGLFLDSSDAVLSRNIVFSNAANDDGGGLFLAYSSATLSGNTVSTNTARYGGGLYLYFSNPTLTGNTVTANTAHDGNAGGVFLDFSDATLRGNTVSANTAVQNGGGLFLLFSDPGLSGNTVVANSASEGGGLYLWLSEATLVNNVVADNEASGLGSGLLVEGSSPRLLHTTVARNTGGDGAGVHVTWNQWSETYSTVALTNTILVSHTVGVSVTGGNTVAVNGILWHYMPITVSQAATATVWVQNESIGDPAFAADGYHITPTSAAVDAGVYSGLTADIDGEARPFGAGPDLGADEWATTETTAQPSSASIITATVSGLTTTVQIPSGAVTESTVLRYTALAATGQPDPAGLTFAGHAFDLDVYQGGSAVPGFSFSVPVTIALQYADTDITLLDEALLLLEYWDGSMWLDAATTCTPTSTYDRHPVENWLAVAICHLSRFALLGESRTIYLPLVLRDH